MKSRWNSNFSVTFTNDTVKFVKSTVKFTNIMVKFLKNRPNLNASFSRHRRFTLTLQSWRYCFVYWIQGGTNVAVNRSHQTPAKPASRSSKSTHHSALRRSARPRGFLGPTWEIHNCRDSMWNLLSDELRIITTHLYSRLYLSVHLNSFGLKTTCGFVGCYVGISQ